MEDRPGSGYVLDPSFANPISDSKATGEKRNGMELGGKSEPLRKRTKMRDLQSVFRSEGSETHFSMSSTIKEAADQFNIGEKEEMSQITEEPVNKTSDTFQTVRTGQNRLSLLQDATRLSLGHVDIAPNRMDLNTKASVDKVLAHDDTPAYVDEISNSSLLAKQATDHALNFVSLKGTGLDLNAEYISSSIDHDPFFPRKIHGHVKSREVSECGSSTGPLEERDSLKVWKEMKQNGFLSSSHGGISMPKQRGRKSKNEMLKKNMELAKREQVNRFTKIAAPSGLLNELNPGIINHVRNSKQVHSIIEALVRSEKLENGHSQSRSARHLKRGTKETSDGRKDLENMHESGTSQLFCEDEPSNTLLGSKDTTMSSNKQEIPLNSDQKDGAGDLDVEEGRIWGETSGTSLIATDCEVDTLTLKLSSSTTMASEKISTVFNEESENQESISCLSVKAATVASQWLELLYQDIRGRLAALQRSKKRVRAVIQTELPSLMSKEFSSNQENDPYAMQNSASGCPKPANIATPEMHQAKWTALFDQMENSLSEEGKHLECWLNQVKEMQLHCEKGLQVDWIAAPGLPQLSRSDTGSRSKKADNSEKELAIRAAAASIYSTCNFAMSTGNVPCF